MSVFDKIKHYKALKNGLKEGNNVTIMGGVNFGSEPYLIELADNVRLSFNVTFVTHDGGTWAFRDNKRYADVIRYGKIYVGEHTFIGTGVIIMPGVTIGKRCVIGAGAVITRDIPANKNITHIEKIKQIMSEKLPPNVKNGIKKVLKR